MLQSESTIIFKLCLVKNKNPEGFQYLYAKANAEPQSGSTPMSKLYFSPDNNGYKFNVSQPVLA
jgi:hypothetical protein